ncbi:MAG: hypothetical protein GY710_06180 [Desulfobacteraceae bacterium]|nr:hypothetical protein [Desulfobacteraceae bacterium]
MAKAIYYTSTIKNQIEAIIENAIEYDLRIKEIEVNNEEFEELFKCHNIDGVSSELNSFFYDREVIIVRAEDSASTLKANICKKCNKPPTLMESTTGYILKCPCESQSRGRTKEIVVDNWNDGVRYA